MPSHRNACIPKRLLSWKTFCMNNSNVRSRCIPVLPLQLLPELSCFSGCIWSQHSLLNNSRHVNFDQKPVVPRSFFSRFRGNVFLDCDLVSQCEVTSFRNLPFVRLLEV